MRILLQAQLIFRVPILFLIVLFAVPFPNATHAASHAKTDGPLRINEFLASNRSGIRDAQGNASDWLELINSGTEIIDVGGYQLSNELDDSLPWIFPQLKVGPGEHILVWMSPALSETSSTQPGRSLLETLPFTTTYIKANAEWYSKAFSSSNLTHNAASISEDWMSPSFDQSTFALGRAGFGYGDDDDETELPPGTTLILMRHPFTIKGDSIPQSLVLRVDYDDGFIAFLNGEKVATANASDGALQRSTLATESHDAGTPESFDLSADTQLLHPGTNLLAIAALNISPESSDLSLHATLGVLPPVCHAHFTLKKKGGQISLKTPSGTLCDRVDYPEQKSDQSFGRSSVAPQHWGFFLSPTPGTKNPGQVYDSPSSTKLTFSPAPGSFPSEIRVRIQAPSPVPSTIRYTIDGSDPDSESPIYTSPIPLNGTVLLKAAAYSNSEQMGAITSGTYLVKTDFELPVLSVSLRESDFREVQLNSQASGRQSERPAQLEFFDSQGRLAIATGFGLRLHGGAGRNGGFETKKSYRTYFRSRYGLGRFDGSIVQDAAVKDFDKLVLRANSNDRAPHGSSIRDQVIRDLHADMGALAARGSWAVLLINSKNRGVYNITERMDEEFFASHLGPGSFDIIKTGETLLSGDREAWNELRQFVERTDFSKNTHFKELSQRVDVANFTSYVIVNMCLQNFDWPHNNWYAARRRPDGKWIFLCWDSEWGLGYRHPSTSDAPQGIDLDPYAFMDSGGASGHSLIRNLFLAMLSNSGYRDYYQEEVRRYLSGSLSPERIIQEIRRHRDAIAHDLEREYDAKNQPIKRWYDLLEEIENFAQVCPSIFQKHTDAYFSAPIQPATHIQPSLIEGPDQQIHLVHGTDNGDLQLSTTHPDSKHWKNKRLRLPEGANRVAGSPRTYRMATDSFHVLYRDSGGQLHDLTIGRDLELSHHVNLSLVLNLPPTDHDPSITVLEGSLHCISIDRQAQTHEIWWNGQWHHHPLPAAPRAASPPRITSRTGSLHVTYQTAYGAPCEQRLHLGESTATERPWRHRLTHRVPCIGSPLGLQIGDQWRILFRPAADWPSSEPFVFHWNGPNRPGYQEYKGSRLGFVQAWDQRDRFHHLTPIENNGTPPAGPPIAVYSSKENQSYLAYRDQAGHIHEARPTASTRAKSEDWETLDLTQQTDAPLATTDPVGLVSESTNDRYYSFIDHRGKTHVLHFDGRWHHQAIDDPVQD